MSVTEKRDIRLIVTDLDGTLLNSQHKITPRNREAIARASAAGIPTVLATGKTRYSSETLIEELGLRTPGIFVQGLLIANADGSTRHQQTLDVQIARRVISFVEERGFSVMAYSGSRLMIKVHHPYADIIMNYGEPRPEIVGPLVNLLDNVPVNKLMLMGDEKRLRALRYQLDKLFGPQINMTTTQTATLEVLPAGASKGKAVRFVAQEMGIPMDKVLAIGDGENDLEMLKLAGWGVAVANADERLKAVAKVVVGSNDDSGVAEAIERFALDPLPEPVENTPEDSSAEASDESAEEKQESSDA